VDDKINTFFLVVIKNKIYAVGGSYPDPQGRDEPLIPIGVEAYDYSPPGFSFLPERL
jgi:hypothetical protein